MKTTLGKTKTPVSGVLILVLLMTSGCIRFRAGTWYQGSEDDAPTVHEVDLNTRQLIPGQTPPPGDITVSE